MDGGLNTYGYVSANPLLLKDPYGLCSCFVSCGGVPAAPFVFCTKTKTCRDECGNTKTTNERNFYYWPNHPFSFIGGWRCDKFPGNNAPPFSPRIFTNNRTNMEI